MNGKLTEVVKSSEKVVTSKDFEIIWLDVKRSLKNAAIFALPLVLLGITELQAGKSFEEIKVLLWAALAQLVTDLIRKYIGEAKYVVDKK